MNLSEILPSLLRTAGAGLILLALMHVPISRKLHWREQAARMSPENEAVFHVHTFFLCLALVLMGLPALLDPSIFLEKSHAAAWGTWSLSGFWLIRLWCQWFTYSPQLWRGKRLETGIHWLFTVLWTLLSTVFGLCGAVQLGWLS
ncbi:MAG: hypothetical protein V4726_04695 [Verrucomicrobiota bacterium]